MLILLLYAVAGQARTATSEHVSGDVVRIIDGDTIVVLVDKREVRVRLAWIDTPERRQPYYQQARQALADKVFRAMVEVEIVDTDRYQRSIGIIRLNGENINAWMVEQGHAWVYLKYSNDPALIKRESDARQARLGLWSMPESAQIPPWEWRGGQR